jgi:hypothetical protein
VPTRKKESKPKPGMVQVTIVPSKEDVSERIYANFLSVNHGPVDFTLTFCDTPTPFGEEEVKRAAVEKVIKSFVQAEIVVPVALIEPIIEALKTNYEVYKKHYGKGNKEG